MITSSMTSGSMHAFSIAALAAIIPSSTPLIPERIPPNLPTGVLAALAITIPRFNL